MKSVFTFYKERLIEISGRNRSLYLKNFNKKNGYDVGKILFADQDRAARLLERLWLGSGDPFELVGKSTKDSVVESSDINIRYKKIEEVQTPEEKARIERNRREYSKRIMNQEVQNLRTLKREILEIEKETGRYELYFCYPFVTGSVKTYTFKAPLLMFPVVLDFPDDVTCTVAFKVGERIQLNKALLFALADSYKLNLDELQTEFDSLSKFKNVQSLLSYLKTFGIGIDFNENKHVLPFNNYFDGSYSEGLQARSLAILARCSLANAIYSDYSALEKKNLTNDSINELLNTKVVNRRHGKTDRLYLINNVDYAQQQVIQKVNENGNMVIYGPPGTGKSQTIVNIISDALAKNKKVLVVSQKRAALDVIFNRLSTLNTRAVLMTDPSKELTAFYEKCFQTHTDILSMQLAEDLNKNYTEVQRSLNVEIEHLEDLNRCLNEKRDFGLSLQEMYYNSYKMGNNTIEDEIFNAMQGERALMNLDYTTLVDSLSTVYGKNTAEMYYSFVERKKENPFIDYLKDDLSIHTVAQAQSSLAHLLEKKQGLFDLAKYKYARQILTYYSDMKTTQKLTPLAKLIASMEYPKLNDTLKVSRFVFPMYPVVKGMMVSKENKIKDEIKETVEEIDDYVKDYDFLKNVLTENGYLMAINGIVNGNAAIIDMVSAALNEYVECRDVTAVLRNLKDSEKTILNFAYKNSTSYQKYTTILGKILPVRIYYEVVKVEDANASSLAAMADFENIRAKIVALNKDLCEVSKQIAKQSFVAEYHKLFDMGKESKDFLYQISKKQNYWPIRKLMDVYPEYMFKLFPCWLLSPENVSSLLPLEKNMFDIVLFDEASQVFIENTIPSIYRGNCVVVAGDAKQLRPTTTFMKRYMGSTIDDSFDYSTQAALEVESLLDLAVSRFNNAHINYHYRSKNEELIDFSNKAFYNNTLQVSPNVSKNIKNKPIERIMVDGLWDDRKNIVEAKEVVKLLKNILKTRKDNETIGIITFNIEQENCIEDLIDEKCQQDVEFRKLFNTENNRIENGEDVSIFIKNLENVQGDERDIIIFSIAYARNVTGRVNAGFGSLSNEGGENRLNVAITRAKKKVYVVTSIEPEELKVDGSKFMGPKLLRKYLTYARAVSKGDESEVKELLGSFDNKIPDRPAVIDMPPLEEQIATKLTERGYNVELNVGNSNSKLSLAVYDKALDMYLLGIETDNDVVASSTSPLERDVFRNEFLKTRGWLIYRVWSRDWWHNSSMVIANIEKLIEKQRKLFELDKSIKKARKE